MFVAPESFPVNCAEAIVNVKQLEILSKAGYSIDVVSRKRKWSDYPVMNLSDMNIKLNSLHTIEVDNHLNWSTIKLHLLTLITFGIVYKGAHWAWPALQICKRLIRKKHYDCVMTKSFPGELVGYWLKKNANIKWIATWNDPFPVEKYPIPYGKGPLAKLFWGAKPLIRVMEKYPDYHLFPSDRLRNYMLRYLNISTAKTRIVPHVVLSQKQEMSSAQDEELSILYSGNLNYPRNPEPLLRAFSSFLKTNPQTNIKIYFQGVLPAKLNDWIFELKLKEFVQILPTVTYKESISMASKYKIVLIIEAPCDEGIFLPTKVSDYMENGKTIFAISPTIGVLHDLYEKGHIGYFAACYDESSILRALTDLYIDYKTDCLKKSTIPIEFSPKYIEQIFSAII